MNRKFFFILFAAVFCNGVTQSSPVGQQILDARLPEEKPPTVQPVTVDHINKKIETASVPTGKPAVPVPHDATPAPPQDVEVATVKNVTVNTTSEAPHVVDGKNATHAEINKNTHVVDNKTVNGTADGKNATLPGDNKNATSAAEAKGSSATDKNSTVTPVPTTAGENSSSTTAATPTAKPTSSNSSSNTSGTTTSPKPPTTVTTPPPSTTTKDGMITGQNNTPAPPPAQEKHFDGASFVGGIVLTIGLTAIGFIAFKYYKSGKIDMSYRTL